MKRVLFLGASALTLFLLLISMLSCAHDQQLQFITVQPDQETFGDSSTPVAADAGLSVQLRALGHYIHPPVVKDITNQVTWVSNTPQMVTVDSTGLLVATGQACGNALVSATVQTNSSAGNRSSSGAIVTGFMTANVVCFNANGGGNPVLTAQISGSGTISSSPPGLGCATTCSSSFPPGTPITITATPTGASTSASWVGCDSGNGTAVCTINSLTSSRTVSVTFS